MSSGAAAAQDGARSFRWDIWKAATGIVGIPAALYALGYLADNSHVALLGMPTGLMSSTKDRLVFEGALFLAGTVQVLIWNLILLAVTAVAFIFYYVWRRVKQRWTPRLPLRWSALGVLSIAVSIFETPIATAVRGIGSGDGAPQDAAARFGAQFWAGGAGSAGNRLVAYSAISYANIAVGVCLVLLWHRGRAKDEGAWMKPLRLLATGLAGLSLLLWPMCYGRLMIPYERPVIEVFPKDAQPWRGLVLNPHGDVWSVWVPKESGRGGPEIRVFEVKALPPLRIIGYSDLFAESDRSR